MLPGGVPVVSGRVPVGAGGSPWLEAVPWMGAAPPGAPRWPLPGALRGWRGSGGGTGGAPGARPQPRAGGVAKSKGGVAMQMNERPSQ